jgi:hypothetical protein
MTDDQARRAAHNAARAIVRAAQNGADTDAFVDAVRIHIAPLTIDQLRIVVGQLAGLLGAFYGADPLSNSGQQMLDALEQWLHTDDGPGGGSPSC